MQFPTKLLKTVDKGLRPLCEDVSNNSNLRQEHQRCLTRVFDSFDAEQKYKQNPTKISRILNNRYSLLSFTNNQFQQSQTL